MKHYFNFTKSQKVGVVALSCIIFIQIILLNSSEIRTVPNPIVVDNSKYLFKNDQFNQKDNKSKKQNQKINYHLFDPNVFNVEDWVSYGFSNKQAQSIVNYKNKIKGFKTKNDLKKVYVISDDKFKELEPFIKIDETKFQNKKEEWTKNDKSNQNFERVNHKQFKIIADLNTSSIENLKQVVGIGEYSAKNIIKFRNKIGGYHSINQLKEVYGITDENLELIKQQVSIDESKIITLNVNQLTIQQLKKHPYISWNVAQAIVEQRENGKLEDLQFLVDKNQLLTQEELLNLLPYIKF